MKTSESCTIKHALPRALLLLLLFYAVLAVCSVISYLILIIPFVNWLLQWLITEDRAGEVVISLMLSSGLAEFAMFKIGGIIIKDRQLKNLSLSFANIAITLICIILIAISAITSNGFLFLTSIPIVVSGYFTIYFWFR